MVAASLNGLARFGGDTVCAAVHRRFQYADPNDPTKGESRKADCAANSRKEVVPLPQGLKYPEKSTKRCRVDLGSEGKNCVVGKIANKKLRPDSHRCENCNENHRTDKRRKILALRVFQNLVSRPRRHGLCPNDSSEEGKNSSTACAK